jgi:hypothetical protein
MPRDTTYHIPTDDENIQFTQQAPGGKDTDIYLDKGVIPPGIDSLPDLNKLIKTFEDTAAKKIPKEDHYVPSDAMAFIFIGITVLILIGIKRRVQFNYDRQADSNRTNNTHYLTYYGEALNIK